MEWYHFVAFVLAGALFAALIVLLWQPAAKLVQPKYGREEWREFISREVWGMAGPPAIKCIGDAEGIPTWWYIDARMIRSHELWDGTIDTAVALIQDREKLRFDTEPLERRLEQERIARAASETSERLRTVS